MALAFQAGDPRAGDEIVRTQQGLVGAVVKRYLSGYRGDRADLVQAGFLGLTRAARRFDPTKGVWSSFAWTWIRKYCLEEVARVAKHADRQVEAKTEAAEHPDEAPSPAETLAVLGDALRLNAALVTLPLGSEVRLRCRCGVGHHGALAQRSDASPALRRRESAALVAALRGKIG